MISAACGPNAAFERLDLLVRERLVEVVRYRQLAVEQTQPALLSAACERPEAGDGLAGLRNHELLALLSAVKQTRKLCLGFVHVEFFHDGLSLVHSRPGVLPVPS